MISEALEFFRMISDLKYLLTLLKSLRKSFDTFMRIYAYFFVLIVLFAFVLNEFTNLVTLSAIRFWIVFQILCLFLAFIFQTESRRIIRNNFMAHQRMISLNNVDRRVDIISLIMLFGMEIPKEVETTDPSARDALSSYNAIPFIHHIAVTIHDHRYLRFAWLKVEKHDLKKTIEHLHYGDCVLTHRESSILGAVIRFFTRCYWEHCGIYVGNGKMMHATLTGVRKDNLLSIVANRKLEFAVLRHFSHSAADSIGKRVEARWGDGYGYLSLALEFWQILTDKKGDGLLSPLTIFVNLSIWTVVFLATVFWPDLRRAHLALLLFATPYLFDTVYHWIAYRDDIDQILAKAYGKS